MKHWISETWVAFGVEILLLSWMGKLSNYLHPKFHVAIVLTAILLIVQFFFTRKSSAAAHPHSVLVLWIVIVVVLFDVFAYKANGHTVLEYFTKEAPDVSSLPDSSASPSLSSSPDFVSSSSGNPAPVQEGTPALLRTNLPWLSLQVRKKKWNFAQETELMGFVLRNPVLVKRGEVALVRVIITCCVADAVGVAVRMPDDPKSPYPENSWLQVRGVLEREGELRKVPWDRYANILFIRGAVLKIDSVSIVNVDVPDPYIFYSSDEAEFRSQY